MLVSSKKAKGKLLEKYVADKFKEVADFVYSRADSGSGKYHKEDITLDEKIPLHIECKNQASYRNDWWEQTINGCPASKCPVLVYRLNYQKDPTVEIKITDLIWLIGENHGLLGGLRVSFPFSEFMKIIKARYKK